MIAILEDQMDLLFLESTSEEIQGLHDRRTYVVVNENDVPTGVNTVK